MRRVFLLLFATTLFFVAALGRASAQTTAADPSTRAAQLEEENKRLRADAEFARRRMALLEAEAERMRQVVQAREAADSLAADRTRRDGIEREVERLRGLRFLHPVDYREIDRAELPTILRKKLAQQVPDQEFDHAGVAFAALGILPAGFDLKKTYLSLLGEQIGAFYDQHEKGLFTFTGHPLSVSTNRVVMAHELTHALEDQHFDLTRLPLEAHGNDDRELAATALVEGDATLVMNRYMTGDLSAATLRDALGQALTTDVRQLASAPLFLREMLLFPYLRGQEFARAIYDEGGWAALNDAFAHPPSSTAQILHPALYLADPREEPIAIEFPDTKVEGGEPVEDNVLGEFGLRQLLLSQHSERARAEETAAGWRGDRYLVYGDGKAVSYIWEVTCRDREAARRLYTALSDCSQKRYQSRTARAQEAVPGRSPWQPEEMPYFNPSTTEAPLIGSAVFRAGERDVRVELTAKNEVVVIDAKDSTWADRLQGKFTPTLHLTSQ